MQLGEDRAIEHLFDVAQPSGDVGSVEDAMIVDQLDRNLAGGRVDRSIGQGRGQGRNGMDLLGTQRAVAGQSESPEPLESA